MTDCRFLDARCEFSDILLLTLRYFSHAVLVDHGLMRLNECAEVKETLDKNLGINLTVIDAADRFMTGLAGVTDPEKKRKFIGNTL